MSEPVGAGCYAKFQVFINVLNCPLHPQLQTSRSRPTRGFLVEEGAQGHVQVEGSQCQWELLQADIK